MKLGADRPKKKVAKRYIPLPYAIVILLFFIVSMVVLIGYTLLDNYTIGAIIFKNRLFWNSPPDRSKLELLIAFFIFYIITYPIYKAIPVVQFYDPDEKKWRRYLRKQPEYEGTDIIVPFMFGNKRVRALKRRATKDGNLIIFKGEGSPWDEGDEITIESSKIFEMRKIRRYKEIIKEREQAAQDLRLENITLRMLLAGHKPDDALEKAKERLTEGAADGV